VGTDAAQKLGGRHGHDVGLTPLTKQVIGAKATAHDERNGYWFWGLVAAFIGIPELLAGFSKTLKADIPWPTISNLVGKDLEAHHHWIALIVVGVIVIVATHTLTYPPSKKKAGRALRHDAAQALHLAWSGRYIVAVAACGVAAGVIGSIADANKNELGYAIYVTLTVTGVVVPSLLAYGWNRVLAIPTLFATIAYLQARQAWVAALVITLLAVLTFHLALYPWPNYHFGSP
jgi:hypothetical protein